ncbi:MAG TPA: branched-chain amino acid ABC transporter permease, partial [Spirochaetales bacterium]|nr:branched-chain amino acid ABC transporter permease [Spirochaetales bacterium]
WCIGFFIEKVAIKSLRGVARIASLICTIGFSIFLIEIANVVFGAETKAVPSFFEQKAFSVGGADIVWYQIFLIGTAGAILLFLQFLVFKTKVGLAIRTVSLDFKTAGLMGINVDRTISFAFSLGGSVAGIAGVLGSVYYNIVNPTMGNLQGLKSFAAAVFGGLTSIPGAILGGYLLAIIENFGVQIVSGGYRDIIGFVILVGFLLFRPQGLLGKKTAM